MSAPAHSDDTLVRLTRRQLTLALIAVLGTGVVAPPGTSTAAIDLALPGAGDPLNPTFDVFLALSRIVLVRSELDAEAAAKMFEIFKREPYGPKHIGTAYGVLRAEILRRQGKGEDSMPPLSALDSNERWFVGHLVSTWYLGIYFHPERPTQRIILDGALMYEAVRGVLPLPYYENIGFGAWAEPPVRSKPE